MWQENNITCACLETGVCQVVLSTIVDLNHRHSAVPYVDENSALERLFQSLITDGVFVSPALYTEIISSGLFKVSGNVISGRSGSGPSDSLGGPG